eukprot:15103255-Alexandrium_andersonii.AAC.1
MGVHHVRPLSSGAFPAPGLLAVRTLGLSRLRPAVQPVPAEAIEQRRAGRAPIFPVQAEELHMAVDQ